MNIAEILIAAAAGAIQGVTELLPISSTGHVLLFSNLTSADLTLFTIAVLHLGTLGSLLVVMKDSLPKALRHPVNLNIIIGIIPAGIIGFVFSEVIDTVLGTPAVIAVSLATWGFGLIVADWYAVHTKALTNDISSISTRQAAVVGAAQVLALVPGTSRSGITTITGIASGMDRKTALSFSFLLGIPLLALSGGYSLVKLLCVEHTASEGLLFIAIATGTAFITGLAAAFIFKSFIDRHILTICGFYRIALSILLILSIAS